MAKQGQHNSDAHDPDNAHGHNKPDKSVTITTGPTKKQETYQQQAAQHQATDRPAQAAKNEWNEDTREEPSNEGSRRDRNSPNSGRSGSESAKGSD
ncbi:MAG TPA: hypothetical protein VM536_08635 [Chloroflexia bacterium]|nr:hypothetical protein [Chloroflexia bacterium]